MSISEILRTTLVEVWKWIEGHDGLLAAIATIVLASLTFSLAHISSGQLQAMRDQLDEMKNEQRPWVSIRPDGHSGITWDEQGMRISVEFNLMNVGKSPATNVFFEAKLALPPKVGRIDIVKQMADYADEIRKRRETGPLAGDILFPGQPHQTQMGMLLTRDEITHLIGSDDHVSFVPRIIACADYTFVAGDEKRSCTSAYIIISKPEKPGMAFGITANDGKLEPDRVGISPTSYNYAN